MKTTRKQFGWLQCNKCGSIKCRLTPRMDMPCANFHLPNRKFAVRDSVSDESWTVLAKARIRVS